MPTQHSETTFEPVALLAAVIIPGAGHLVRKQTRRAIGVATGVLGLFFGGLLVGGIDVIDRREDAVWFYAQGLVGPLAFGVDHLHQSRFKVVEPASVGPGRAPQLRSAFPGELRRADNALAFRPEQLPPGSPMPAFTVPNRKSISKPNELGTLAAALAGMLNLIAIIDAGFPTTRRRFSRTLGGQTGSASKGAA